MAAVLPNRPVGITTPEILRLFRLLKGLPDGRYFVWHRLSIHHEPGPDFWVLCDGRSMLLKVAATTAVQCRNARQANLFGSLLGEGQDVKPVGLEEHAALHTFVDQLSDSESGVRSQLITIPRIVVFPNASKIDLEQAKPSRLEDGSDWVGRDVLQPDLFASWVDSQLGSELSKDALNCLRKAFTPEVMIPQEFTVCKTIDRATEAQLTECLLDYHQEQMLKVDLDLSTEASKASRDFGLRLVNGVAGSGKSLIIIYRAHLLRKFYPRKRILILTHNKALAQDLVYRYQYLSGDGRSVPIMTFLGWCRANWPKSEPWSDPIGLKRRETLLMRAWRKHLADTSVSVNMLRDEMDWFKDRLLTTWDDYQDADRRGRGFALNQYLQPRMFKAMMDYQQLLDQNDWIDWGDVPRRVWRSIEKEGIKVPQYDAILIDEAQFFAPIWFEIVKAILKPRTGHLFMVADPSQGFLKRRESWVTSGLQVRGRSHYMRRSYRTTLEILNSATLLYRTRLPDDEDGIVSPDLLDMPRGIVPQIIPLTSQQDEVTRVVNEIKALVAQNVPAEHILVIHANWDGKDRLLQRLQSELGKDRVADPRDRRKGDFIRVITLNATTGLESPIVFLVGTHLLFEKEQSLRLSDEERTELVGENTRKLYMAMTRAGKRLVLTYVGDVPKFLQRLPDAPLCS